jgi:hypothetical protein
MVDEQEVEAYLEGESDELNTAQEQEEDEIEDSEDAIRELAQTDFDFDEESTGRMGELLKGIGFNSDSETAQDFIEEMNLAVTEIALDMGVVGEEDLPDDLVSELE